MIYHLTTVKENSKVTIRTSDRHVLVIALGYLEHIPESINLWLEVGLYAKNSVRYIDVRKLFNKLGSIFLLAVTKLQRFQEKEKSPH